MSLTCEKEMTITIGVGIPDPFYYYKLETFAANTLVDSVAARNILKTFGGSDPTVVPAKIGDGYQYAFNGILWIATRTNADANIQGIDVTIRAWVFPTTGSDYETNIEFRGGGSGFFELRSRVDVGVHNAYARIRTNVASPIVEISTGLVANQWNHVMVWHDNGTEIGVRVNNGTPATIAHTTGIEAKTAVRLDYLANNATAVILDELSIWKELLTDAQQTADWNGGAGATYPFS